MFAEAVTLIKSRLGISTTVRDAYLFSIVEGLVNELRTVQGITLDDNNPTHLMFVADYGEYRYSNRDNPVMPRHLQFRMHNLMIHNKIPSVANIMLVDALPITPIANTVYILADGSKQIYINSAWLAVDMVNGLWVTA